MNRFVLSGVHYENARYRHEPNNAISLRRTCTREVGRSCVLVGIIDTTETIGFVSGWGLSCGRRWFCGVLGTFNHWRDFPVGRPGFNSGMLFPGMQGNGLGEETEMWNAGLRRWV